MSEAARKQELIKILKTLANERRLAILKILKSKGERSVGQIADRLEMPFNTVSKNLVYLAKNRILEKRYDGNFVLYKISGSLAPLVRSIIDELP